VIGQQGAAAHFVAAAVTKSAEVRGYVKAALDTYGAIDCFFNNAGIEGKLALTAEPAIGGAVTQAMQREKTSVADRRQCRSWQLHQYPYWRFMRKSKLWL
jgi:NAD(P)-dependent dehydrogenase (short-subunit alcohol dehydrogenase family)